MRLSRTRIVLVSTAVVGVLALAGTAIAGTYTVKKGDTLSEIAERQGLNGWSGLYDANRGIIRDPDLIYPGQRLALPDGDTSRVSSSSIAKASDPEPTRQFKKRSRSTSKPRAQRSSSTSSAGVWDRIAQCESGGNWSINTGNGYYGGLQFTLSSWRAAGGSGMPNHASKSEQIRVAERLQDMQGWGAWPTCSRRAGLR